MIHQEIEKILEHHEKKFRETYGRDTLETLRHSVEMEIFYRSQVLTRTEEGHCIYLYPRLKTEEGIQEMVETEYELAMAFLLGRYVAKPEIDPQTGEPNIDKLCLTCGNFKLKDLCPQKKQKWSA